MSSNCCHVFEPRGGTDKNYSTVLIAINATGFMLAPFILFSGKNLMDSWCRGGPEGTVYGVTETVRKCLRNSSSTLFHSPVTI